MSPSYIIDYHLLGNIGDHSNLCVSQCHLHTVPTPSSLGGSNHSQNFCHLYTDDSHTHTWRSSMSLSSHSGWCSHSILVTCGAGTKKREAIMLKPEMATWGFIISLSVICTWLKISIIRRLFFLKRIHQNLEEKKFKERNSQLKIGLFMRDILSSSEGNNSFCGEGRRKIKGLHLIYLKNKSYISSL